MGTCGSRGALGVPSQQCEQCPPSGGAESLVLHHPRLRKALFGMLFHPLPGQRGVNRHGKRMRVVCWVCWLHIPGSRAVKVPYSAQNPLEAPEKKSKHCGKMPEAITSLVN